MSEKMRIMGESKDVSCKDCAFWVKEACEDKGMGECRYGPPSVLLIDDEPDSVWPATDKDDFCGCFLQRSALTAAIEEESETDESDDGLSI